MEKINKTPLVDILTDMIGEQIAMDGDSYITMADNVVIADTVVADALVKQGDIHQESLLAKVKAEAQAYLSSTDWVTAKYTDLVVIQQTMTNEVFNAKYADVLAERNEARAKL
jgi:hypothetical protein